MNHLGIDIKPLERAPRASPVDRAPKRKRPTPSANQSAEASSTATGVDGQDEDEAQFAEERRSSRVKKMRDMPSAEELRIIQEKQDAEKAAFLTEWLENQPVASHKSKWLGPANARVPPNRETGEPLTKSQQQKIAPWADLHRTCKLSWFNEARQSKNMRKHPQFNRMYSHRALAGIYGSPAPLLKDAFHPVIPPNKLVKK